MKCIETHLSKVYLDEEVVYKMQKSVRFPFVDFSTVALREAGCAAEVAHNTPWAPGVYLGVVPVTVHEGTPAFETDGTVHDHAVKMKRLPESRTLTSLGDTLDFESILKIGHRVREVHQALPARPLAALPYLVRRRIFENYGELLELGHTLPSALLRRVGVALQRGVNRAAAELEQRSAAGQVLHGDLRADHVYLLEDEVIVLDGVAFAPALAEGDPAEDVAFLAMDLTCNLARWDLEPALWTACGVDAPRDIRDLYTAHRALIRAKVALHRHDVAKAQVYLLHVLTRLEPALHRPALIAVGGLPGAGKSTLAARIAQHLHFDLIRTDVVRKELGAADYSDDGRTAVYAASFAEAEQVLNRGGRVVVDGSFGRREWRAELWNLARRTGIRPVLLLCDAPEAEVLARLAERKGDASDADAEVYRLCRGQWEDSTAQELGRTRRVDSGGTPLQTLQSAIDVLAELDVAYPMVPPET